MHQQTVKIDKVINNGFGIARLPDNQVIFIPYTLPGELVTVSIHKKKRTHLFGRLKTILEKHPSRRAPPCPYYGCCGGCNLQHCTYPSQLTIKENIINDLLLRSQDKNLSLLEDRVLLPLPAPEEFNYRQRIKLQINEQGEFGFYKTQSHVVIPITSCLLVNDTMNKTLDFIGQHQASSLLLNNSSALDLLYNPTTKKVILIFTYTRKIRPNDKNQAQILCDDSKQIERIFFQGDQFALSKPIWNRANKSISSETNSLSVNYENIGSYDKSITYSWEVGSFCQVNLAQNKTLIEIVLQFCTTVNPGRVLDLYCGMGNFSIPVSFLADEVLGFEGQGAAIRGANKNSKLAGLHNAEFTKTNIHTICQELTARKDFFDCVIIDPPRAGAPNLAKQLAALTDCLIYISCDPATLCRDLSTLSKSGFSVTKIQPVDMFPQTDHIETVTLLER